LNDVFPVTGTSTFGAAYNTCLTGSIVYSTCEIWDYNLTYHPETMYMSPWNFDGLEVPVHLRFGPGVLTIYGPLIVPRNSIIEGAGRAAGSYASGTVIKVAGPTFGGVGYITASGGSGCPASGTTVNFSSPNSPTYPASATWTMDGLGNFTFQVQNPGGGYGGAMIAASLPTGTCTTMNPTLTVHPTTSAVIIGDTNTGSATGSAFGSRLMNVTVDCNYVTNCTAIEIQNGQEESGPVFVSAANYGAH
jgi:hypothetical protein